MTQIMAFQVFDDKLYVLLDDGTLWERSIDVNHWAQIHGPGSENERDQGADQGAFPWA